MLGYKIKDIEKMQTAIEYAIQDADNSGEDKQSKELTKVFELLEGLLVEGWVK